MRRLLSRPLLLGLRLRLPALLLPLALLHGEALARLAFAGLALLLGLLLVAGLQGFLGLLLVGDQCVLGAAGGGDLGALLDDRTGLGDDFGGHRQARAGVAEAEVFLFG